MPFCPECRFEYVPEVKRCPECGARLVQDMPAAPPRTAARDTGDQVLLGIVIGEIHAKLVQDALASQGIPSRLQSGWPFDSLLGTVHAPPPPIGGSSGASYAIFVNRSDLPRALVIYDDFEQRGADAVDWEQLPDTSGS